VADRQRRKFLARLPLGRKRGRPAGIAVEIPLLVGERESAVRTALQEQVPADAQDEEIHMAVAADVDRIRADHVLKQFRIAADVEGFFFELKGTAGLRPVDEQLRRILAAGEKDRGEPGAVAIECRPAASDEEFPWAVVDALDPRRHGFLMHHRHRRAASAARRRRGRR
jgi:hypothetical protein